MMFNGRGAQDAEVRLSSLREEFLSQLKKLGVELRAEIKASTKQEQISVAALDEQLWRTDQRLGQRIDELFQQGLTSRVAAVSQSAVDLASARGERSFPTALGEMRSPRFSGNAELREPRSEPRPEPRPESRTERRARG